MSLLLDAIKQSGQHEQNAIDHDQAASQLKQQQELKRYRILAIGLGMVLGLILTLMAGFSIGKWLQGTNNTKILTDTLLDPTADTTAAVKDENKADEKPLTEQKTQTDPAAQTQLAQQANTQVPAVNNMGQPPTNLPAQQYQWVQVPVYNQQGAVVMTYQQQPVYQQQGMVQGQPYYQAQPQFAQPMMAQNNYQAVAQIPPQMNQNVDLSQYKVLGKPLDSNSYNQAPTVKQAQQEDELEGVPEHLKEAFAQAVREVDSKPRGKVTSSTRASSYAEPIELLAEDIQSSLPGLKYQAHIYASEPDKRWIKINNRELYEGDNIGVLTLLEITPEQSLFSYDGYEFTLKALQDWPE